MNTRLYPFITATIVRSKVVKELTKSHSMTGRPETLILRERLSDVQGEIVRQACTQMLPYLVLFVVPMLWTKHDYALPLTWLAVPIIGFKVAKSADSRMKTSTSTSRTLRGTFASKATNILRSRQGPTHVSRSPTVGSLMDRTAEAPGSVHTTETWADVYVRSTHAVMARNPSFVALSPSDQL
jgi:hypothetical protein